MYIRNNPITNKLNEARIKALQTEKEASKAITYIIIVIVFMGLISSFI